MAKGNRQRANVKSPEKATKTSKIIPIGNMPSIMKDYPVRTLNNNDVNQLKQLVGLSNNVIKLMQQCADTEKHIKKGNEIAKGMLKGTIKGPALEQITPSLYLPSTDMESVAKKIKKEVAALKMIDTTSKAQLTQQYNDYLNTMRNIKQSFEQLLVNAPKQEVPKVIFEKDISKLTKKDAEFLKTIKSKIDKKAKK